MPREVAKRVGATIKLHFGNTIPTANLDPRTLYDTVYDLAP